MAKAARSSPRCRRSNRKDQARARSPNARPITGVDGAAMSRACIKSARNPIRPASTASAKARAIFMGSPALAIAVFEQHRVKTHFHRRRRMRGRADPGIDDQRHIGKMRAQRFQRIGVVETAPGADRRSPRHQNLTARRQEAFPPRQDPRWYREKPETLRG